MRGELYFRVLGPVVAERNGDPLQIHSVQQRGVLALLLLRGDRVVSVDEFAEALWGDAPPASYRVQLQGLISKLRRLLGPAARIETQAPGYRLRLSPGQLDLAEFRRDVAAAQCKIAAGELEPAAGLLTQALSCWRGPAFADIPFWVTQQAAVALDELRVTALEDRIETDIALGRHDGLISELATLTQDHPLRERFHGQLMMVLSQAGRAAEALAAYRRARELMVGELGIEPSAQLQELHRAILMGTGGDRTGRRTRTRAYLRPRQLPSDVPVLVGRDDLLSAAAALLRGDEPDGAPPCVAVIGAGGVGKTAFALRLAHRVRDAYPDGQLFARLGGGGRERASAGAVLARFLHALGVPPGGAPADLDERAGLFRDLLADRRVLIVLDDVADEVQLRPLLPAEPGSGLLLTSRRRLAGVEGLRPVALDVLPADAAVALLREVAGASRVDAEASAAAEVVRHCGGLPLAIRIGGARLATRPNWAVGDLARRLADFRGRLDWLQLGDLGVRASVTESYSTLAPDQQRLFRRLGLLDSPEFAAWLPAPLLDLDTGSAERLLDDLVEAHLVEFAGRGVTGPRYRMHDLVHLVARELTADIDAEPDRSAALYRALHGWLALAVTADTELPHWTGLDPEPPPRWSPPDDVRAAVRDDPTGWFDEERGTLIGVVRQAAEEGHPAVSWPLAQRLSAYLSLRGRYEDWADVLMWGLRAAEKADDKQGRATMLGLSVLAAADRDEFQSAVEFGLRTLIAYRELGSAVGWRADPAPRRAPTRMSAEYEAALRDARRSGNPIAVGLATVRLIEVRWRAGEHADYLSLFEEVRDAFRASGTSLFEAWALKFIGLVYCRQGRYDEAEECLHRVYVLIRDFTDGVNVAYSGGDLAGIAAAHGRLDEAETMARDSLRHARADGDQWSTGRSLVTLGDVSRARHDYDAALDTYLEALAVWRSLKVPTRVAQVLWALSEVCAEIGDPNSAAVYRAEYETLPVTRSSR